MGRIFAPHGYTRRGWQRSDRKRNAKREFSLVRIRRRRIEVSRVRARDRNRLRAN